MQILPPERLRKFKSENKRTTNKLHKKAREKAKKICNKFHIKLTNECIKNPYILDLYIKEAKTALEIDGACHESIKSQCYDERRDSFLADQYGITVCRFTPDHLKSGLFEEAVWVICYKIMETRLKEANAAARERGFRHCIPNPIWSY